ncbi:Outer membrane protein assembly factor BamE precursor [Pigmentiphaga humi]|uniref:Outer membrane protein assembly factor BamE n=1 Tax=Pigmentiphaga humi TaxID=2478468 RepID=A0A3P4B2F9_9BURK|nr:Outer membrane protein assembly factor BamE precursor [Pigmentiphaga humi]
MPNALTSIIHGRAGFLRRLAPAALLGLAACSTVNNYVPGFIKPYRADIQQGNWLTQEQIELLRPGMTREQVRFALGSPTLTSVFHADRWDYPYLFTPGNGPTEERKFTVYFAGDRLERWSGDPQPSRQPFQQKDTRKPLSATPATANPEGAPTPTVDGNAAPTGLDPSAPPSPAP